jgi:hypothetical protein
LLISHVSIRVIQEPSFDLILYADGDYCLFTDAGQAIGITIPGFGLEQAMIGKRKALPSKISERHLKKLRAVQQAKDRDAGRIH